MKKLICNLVFLFLLTCVSAQTIKSIEFHNQEISDILLVLAESSGTSIIPDETVTGKASFYFSDSTLQEALENFSNTYNLFFEKEGNIIKVSKKRINFNQTKNTVSVKANDVSIESIFKGISSKIGKTILYDMLPQSSITVDMVDLPIEEALKICIKKYPDYEVETNENYFYVKKIPNSINGEKTRTNSKDVLTRSGDLYTLKLDKGRALNIVTKLFTLQNQEYSLFIQSDIQLENLYFADKDFNTMLSLILEHMNADYIVKNNIYYLIDLQKKGVAGKLKDVEIVNLTWIQASDITSLLPVDLSSSSNIKIDKSTNSLLLSGTKEELKPIKEFISKIDIPNNGLQYKKINVNYLDAKDVLSLLPAKLVQTQPVLIPGTNSILVTGSKESIESLENFITDIDYKNAGIPIQLKYIKVETLLKNLPPSISKETIIDSGYPNLIFYTGTEANLKLFMHELDAIDKPEPQIKYQLLVIQYQKGKSDSFTPSLMVNKAAESSDKYVFAGELSNIMSLQFDVISKFGYQFATSLNAKIQNNTANVFTDTTLTGISGQDIKFQNTDTYRYIEYDYDTTSSTTSRTSTTQQITSGLIVNLNGWISGDNMITMTVNATISKQNSDSGNSNSKSLTTLPSTSERVVTTQVRAKSGEPIIISGLIKDDDSEISAGTPFLSQIPLFGHLFKQSAKTKDKTEIVIYIVPHLIQEYTKSDNETVNMKRYYEEFVNK